MWTFNTALVLLASCLLGSLLDTVRSLVITPTTGLLPTQLAARHGRGYRAPFCNPPAHYLHPYLHPTCTATQPACNPMHPSLQPHGPQVEAVARNGGCELLRLLGRALPSQSSFFINFLLQARACYLVITPPSQSSFFINFLLQ